MHFINYIINIFYPNACGICGNISKYNICPKCKARLNKIKQCKKHIYLTRSFTDEMYIFKYKDLIRESFLKYKFGEQNYKYKAFANFIIKDKKICGFLKKYDIIIPVPISKKRKTQRGYNQSELIIKECARLDKTITVCKDVLYKIKDTKPQSTLDKEQRKINIQGAYKVQNSNIINNKKVLLFDDIYTTGSTLEECAKVLKKSGAYEVSVLTFAKD